MKRPYVSARRRTIAGLLCMVLLFTSFYAVSSSAEAELPKAFLVYDQDNGELLTYDSASGEYVTNENYTAAFVGTGAQLTEDGYLSEKALSFSDQTTHLEVTAAEGYSLAPGGSGITVSFWMKEFYTTGSSTPGSSRGDVKDKFETLLAGTDAGGESALLCVDGVYYLVDSEAANRHYVQGSDNRVGSGTAFFYDYYDWVQCTVTVTANEVLVYQNGEVHYGYNSSTGTFKKASGATGSYTGVGFAKTLFDGLTAEGGKLEFRSDLYSDRNTRSLRLDGLKIYDGVLTADQAKQLYDDEYHLEFTVTLDYNDGMTTEALTVVYGETVSLPSPTRAGYEFNGWYLDAAATEPFEAASLKASAVLYAGWTPIEYPIRYVSNGGVLTDPPASYTSAESVVLPIPTREGYRFTGWYRTAELAGSLTMTFPEQYGDLTVYAGWEPIAYTVAYELDGGVNHSDNPTLITIEDGVVTLESPLKRGYVFMGWYADEMAVEQISSGADITLRAVWKAKPGDINGDDKVSIFDVVYLLQAINGTATPTEDRVLDLDKDEAVTTADAMMLMRYIDGVITVLEE